jgi:putative addiction module component (TIGR02574 family)
MTAALRQQLFQLQPEEKIRLIGELWDSLDDSDIPDLTPEQKAELERRVREHKLHPEQAIPWPTLRAELRRSRK